MRIKKEEHRKCLSFVFEYQLFHKGNKAFFRIIQLTYEDFSCEWKLNKFYC